MAYTTLNRAQLSFDYLHTNSTTHEFLFGALAELLDNARDADATKINIYTVRDKELRGGFMMCFLDDGEGMDPNETADIVTFGKSAKKSIDLNQIGMYGNGLKSGSMRIGNDLILFTKKGMTMSCLFLSRTFHEEEHIDEVIVPLPAFEASTRRPLTKGARAAEKHEVEMGLIYKYSPFRSEEEFFAQFDKIEGNSGTLVVVYNLKLLDSGDPELDINSDPEDILLANPESDFDPDAEFYKYSSNRFKARSEHEAKRAMDEATSAENKAREAESKSKNLENKVGSSISRDQRADLRKAQTFAAECRREAQIKRQIADRKSKALKDPKTLNFIFGMNLENRVHDGVFVYNCSRLIKMYEKVGPQAEGGVNCSGVVGIVDVPYLVLEPTHNKQDFADSKEFRHLMKAMGEHMSQYWKDVGIVQQGVTKFWENFGYISPIWTDRPSDDVKYVRKRAMQINVTLQCDMCLKWRTLPFSSNNIGKEFPDSWVCNMNTEQQHNKCSSAEQKMNIPEGILKKEVKTQEQKKKDLEEEIRKKQDMLEKMQRNKVIKSSKELQELQRMREEEKLKEKEREIREKERQREEAERQKQKEAKEREKQREKEARQRERERLIREREREAEAREREKEREKAKKTVSRGPSRTATVRTPEPARKSNHAAAAKNRATVAKVSPKPSPRTTPKPSPKTAVKSKVNDLKSPTPKAEAIKRRASSASSTAESDTESRRSRNSQSRDSDSETAPAKRTKTQTVDSDSETPVPKKQPKPGIFSPSKPEDFEENEADATGVSNALGMDVDDVTESVCIKDADSNGEIGQRVEAYVNNKWYPGVVVKVNAAEAKWKVKFDNNQKDKYDKWFEKGGSDIRTSKPGQTGDTSTTGPPSPASISSHDTATEAPTSSTATPAITSSQSSQITDEIANGYRTCLRYFLPPQWIMDKETISAMSLPELAGFPLDDFFDHYEKGLRRLVSNFQTEASVRKQEAEESQQKLSSVRKLIAKLLKSINDEFDIDPDSDGDQVDELLAACVRQAMQGSQS